jgi:hypothetical protein
MRRPLYLLGDEARTGHAGRRPRPIAPISGGLTVGVGGVEDAERAAAVANLDERYVAILRHPEYLHMEGDGRKR